MTTLTDPSLPGKFNFKRVVYAPDGLNYLQKADLQNHCVFEHPTPQYETRTVDLTEVVNFEYEKDFPFDKTRTPINGFLCVPEGDGPFPVVVFVHGNFNNFHFISAPGFLYLCDLLASQGILAATIDVSFLGSLSRKIIKLGEAGEVAGRAVLILEHLKQFKLWNEQENHPLQNKVNLDQCMLVGHSFGGESVGHASVLNRQESPIQFYKNTCPVAINGSQNLGPYNFGIQAVIALAPTDGLYNFPEEITQISDNYLVIQGSRDEDIFVFSGHLIYDRIHFKNDRNNFKFKSLLWIVKANHNFFNSCWEEDFSDTETIERQQQEEITKTYVSAIAQAVLYNCQEYLKLLQNYRFGVDRGWLRCQITFISQYQSSKQLIIQDFEEHCKTPKIYSPVTEIKTTSGVSRQVLCFQRPSSGFIISNKISKKINKFICKNKNGLLLDYIYHLYQDAYGLRLDWTQTGGRYILILDPMSLRAEEFDCIAFRVGQSFEPNNKPEQHQDFFMIIHDNNKSLRLRISSLQSLPYPDSFQTSSFPKEPTTILQSIFIPFAQLRLMGLNPIELSCLEFAFDITESGTLYINDIQLTRIF